MNGAVHRTDRTSSCSTGLTPSTTRWWPTTVTGAQARIPARSAEFARPLLTAVGAGEKPGEKPKGCAREHPLPAPEALLRIDAGGVLLEALKPAGNPTAEGRSAAAGRYTMLRLVDMHGSATDVTVESTVGSVKPVAKARLLEDAPTPIGSIGVDGFEIATVLADVRVDPRVLPGPPLGPDAEAAQPIYARYWLHNRGPAPLGGLPAVAYLHPERVRLTGTELRLRLTAVSDCTDTVLSGTVEMVCAPDWSVETDRTAVRPRPGRAPGGDIAVTVPAEIGPGLYPVRARLTLGDDGFARPPGGRPSKTSAWSPSAIRGDMHVLRLVEGPDDVVARCRRRGAAVRDRRYRRRGPTSMSRHIWSARGAPGSGSGRRCWVPRCPAPDGSVWISM